MEKNIENNKPNQKNRSLSIIIAILSTLLSLVLAGYSIYLSALGNYWFIAIGFYFLFVTASIVWPLFKQDDYEAMHLQGVLEIIGVLFIMPYLIFMILWNDPNGLMKDSLITYLVLGISSGLFIGLYVISRLINKKDYQPLLHAYSNNGLIIASVLIVIIELIIVNYFYPGSSTAIFDNLLKEKPLWIYIIDILVNATMTVIVAFLALSTAIRADTKEELNTKGKIQYTLKWFTDHEISMFFTLLLTLYLAVLSIINMKQSFFYILLFIYYIGNATIRIINYVWHKKIQKICGDNQIKDNRLSSWILLFDAFTYLAFSDVLVVAAIFMMIQKANAGANIYLFLFMNVPLAIVRWFTANKSIRKNRRGNNTYRLGLSLIGLVNVFFTILEVIAISFHQLPIVWIRYVFIILAIIAVKIAVIVVAIIFVIHWIRSIILNRRSKERKYLKEKEMQ